MEDVSGHLNDGTLSHNHLLANERAEMLLDARLESSINDVVESPPMEGPPLPSESPTPLPPLPTSPLPSSPSSPPPPPMLHLQALPPLVSSGPPQVGNLQPPLPPQPSVAPQLFLHPPSVVPPTDYSVSAGTHLVQIYCNTSQQMPSFPSASSGSLNTPGYSSVYGVPQAGHSNQQFQQNQQFLPSQATFTPRAFPPVTVPHPPSGHFSYNPTIQLQMAHPHLLGPSYSEGLRRIGDEQWRPASVGFKSVI